jgi:hypothetical protein
MQIKTTLNPSHARQNGYHQNKNTTTNAGKDVEKRELLHTVDRSVN